MGNLFKIKFSTDRIYGLDILRASAILFVVIGHGEYLMPKDKYKYINFFVLDGVSIFFVLSGFLIGGILIKLISENKINLKLIVNFWIRRWYRTLPNYLLILIILLILNLFFTTNFDVYSKGKYFLFIQNLYNTHPIFFPEAWSLSIEEWFYIILPILMFLFIKILKISKNKSILITVLIVITTVTLYRYVRYYNGLIYDTATWDSLLRKQVITRLDSLMYGVLGAYISIMFKNIWNKYRIHFFLIGVSLFVLMRINPFSFVGYKFFHSVLSFSITSIATLLLLPYLSFLKSGKGLVYRSITCISLISYSMYLVNLTLVQQWIIRNIDFTIIENFNGYVFLIFRYILYWFFTITISIFLYKYFEMPVMNLRDKLKNN